MSSCTCSCRKRAPITRSNACGTAHRYKPSRTEVVELHVVKEEIQSIVESTLRDLGLEPGGRVVIEAPRDPRHGDFSTNVALVLAKKMGRTPADLARELVARLAGRQDLAADVSIAGPGFINFKLREGTASPPLGQLLSRGDPPGPPGPGPARPPHGGLV